MNRRAIIFDIGDVLLIRDVYRLYRQLLPDDAAIDAFFDEVGFHAWSLEFDRGRSYAEGVRELTARFPHRADLIRAYDERWEEMAPGAAPGSLALLECLRQTDVELYALTNFSADKWPIATARYPFLSESFRDVVVSGHAGLVKPDPAIYRLLLERNGLAAKDCLFIDAHAENVAAAAALGLDAIQFTSADALERALIRRALLPPAHDSQYNFAYLDEQTKRMIRRALLKAVAIPGYQTPFASREMPMPYGWGTGGVQVTAACLRPDDVLKVIDQGADDTTNAVSIRKFFQRTAGVAVTERTTEATLIQTRHRIPEQDLSDRQILIYQVPIPEPLRFLEPRETETRKMHALEEYGLMHVKLYEDISQHGHVSTAYAYPVKVEDRYVMDPSPIPKFDNPKLEMAALQLFGAGREQRLYAIPPYTRVAPLDFEDHPFEPGRAPHECALCAAIDSYLDEVIIDDAGGRMFVCSDTDYCRARREAGHVGAKGHDALEARPKAADA